MNKAITKIALLLIIISTSYFWFEAKACTCAPPDTLYREYQKATAVFIGKVISSKDIVVPENKSYAAYERVFQFSVTESLKGLKTSTVEISVGRVDSSCYQGFAVGESYLVYAYNDDGNGLYAGACTRTEHLSGAADDLHYIRDLLNGVPEPRVYGSVMRVDSDLGSTTSGRRVTPLKGVKVLIEGEGKTFEAVTDEQGLYSLPRLPDGEYMAHPLLPKKYMAYYPAEEKFILGSKESLDFRIQRGPSAYATFRIGWNNHLNGRIVDSEGNAIVRAKVSILIARTPSPLVIARDQFDYHPEGKFQFNGLNPGNYLLSAEIRAPFADNSRATTFYYPNASVPDQAREISIGENETLDEREIRLPPGYLVRQVEGVLVWPNGVPVSRGWVYLAASKDSADDEGKYDFDSTDELGRFSIQAFVGGEYWVHGESNSSGKGTPIKIKVQVINEPLKIVIPFPKRIER